ncbi:Mannan endo-1,4-beta-mannosidase, partial [Nowakowskiella sp. JEL0078]
AGGFLLKKKDFPFACATYPLHDPKFVSSCLSEITDNVVRLRHHASLILWCGNNEIESLASSFNWWKRTPPALAQAYEQFFYTTLPEHLSYLDSRPFWSSSPSSGSFSIDSNAEAIGDAHLWEVYHGLRAPAFYNTQRHRFVSEFGFQSLPVMTTVRDFTAATEFKDRDFTSHQMSVAGNVRLAWYIAKRFRVPRSIEAWVYFSQIYAGEAVRVGVEGWRRHPECTTGAIYWQLNDIWPGISWSTIDYYGRCKASHWITKRAFENRMVSVDVNKAKKSVAIWAISDNPVNENLKIFWSLESFDGKIYKKGEIHAKVFKFSELLEVIEFGTLIVDWKNTVFVYESWFDDQMMCVSSELFVEDKFVDWADPGLTIEKVIHLDNEAHITVSAIKGFAKFVELVVENNLGAHENWIRLSNNFFDIPVGRKVT